MKILKTLKKTPMLIVFIFILLFLTPTALVSPGENRNRAVVTAVGIDKLDDGLEISFLTFIPTANQSYKETNSVISGKGNSVAEAVYEAELTLGRKIGLSHARTTVIGESILDEDITKYVNYLSRISVLPENSVMVSTNDTAKEFLITAQSLSANIGLKLEQLIHFNAENIFVTDTTIESFYDGYYSEDRASIIGYLELENLEGTPGQVTTSQDTSSSGGGSGGSGGSGGGSGQDGEGGSGGSGGDTSSQEQKQIWNRGDTVILKNGKKVLKLSVEQLNGINIINQKISRQTIFLPNVTDGVYNGADLTYILRNKQVRTATKFENGHPIFKAYLVAGVELVEINNVKRAEKVNTEFSEISPVIESLIQDKLRKEFAATLKLLRLNKADILEVRDKFLQDNRKEFEKFLERLEDPEDYLNHITFKFVIDVQAD